MKTLLGIAAVVSLACVDLSAPKNAPASISLLQVPAFFVVRGDVMRDSLGNPVKPAIIAYDGAGNPMTGFTPAFFITDSNAVAHFNANGVLAGDRLGTVHVLGQIGNLQTPSTSIFVTVAPTKLDPVRTDTLRVPVGADSASSLGTSALRLTVRGAGDTAVAGVFVRFTVVRVPLAKGSSPAGYLTDDAGRVFTLGETSVDTADVSGAVSRSVVVNSRQLGDAAVVSGTKADSVIVEARAKYRGVELAGSPARFVVPVKVIFGR